MPRQANIDHRSVLPRTAAGSAVEALEGRRLLSADAAPLNGALPQSLVDVNGTLFYAARSGPGGWDLWKTNGAPGTTLRVKDFAPGGADETQVYNLVNVKGKVFFVASDAQGGDRELWFTDGTTDGTRRVKDIVPGPGGSSPSSMTAVGDTLYFGATDAAGVESFWKSDGTEAGTVRVKDISPRFVAQVGDTLLLAGAPPNGEGELWTTDGTEAGTVRLNPNRTGRFPSDFFVADGVLFYSAVDDNGRELWRSDGTAAGTQRVKDIFPGPAHSNPNRFIAVNGTVFFVTVDSLGAQHLWKTDGTEAGTLRVKDNVGRSFLVFQRADLNGTLLFTAYDSPGGFELWKSDGSEAGTARVADISPGMESSTPAWLTNVGGTVFFAATTQGPGGTLDEELWKSDGTEAGTVRVADVNPGGSSSPDQLTASGGKLYFAATDAAGARELWVSDGTAGGTTRVSYQAPSAAVVGRHVFYNHSTFDGREEAPNAADEGAIATDKVALLPGQRASFGNVTSYSRGINGIMFDVNGNLPLTALVALAGSVGLKAGAGGDPATWADAPRPTLIGLRPGAGFGGSDRVTLVWPDGAIKNTWLRVTAPALPEFGLSEPDVFYFGNLLGEVGNAPAGDLAVNTLDLLAVRRGFFSRSPVTGRLDFDRDEMVTAADFAAARSNVPGRLALPSAPAVTSAPGASGADAGFALSRSSRTVKPAQRRGGLLFSFLA